MNSQTHDGLQLDDLYPIDKLAAAYPDFLTVTTLRWHLRHRDVNGLRPACVRVGNRLLISKTRYEAWLTARAGAPQPRRRVA